MSDKAVRNLFFSDLLEANGISDFSRWFFYSGMLYGSYDKWWGKGGVRPSSHEGLDICFFHDSRGSLKRLGGTIHIPVMGDGVVFDISSDDFIDSSIFVRHDFKDANGHYLHSVYAHSHPVKSLRPGQTLRYGDVVATMGDPLKRNLSIPAHIHVSMVYLPEDYPKDMLSWKILSLSYQARLVDPIGYLDCDYVTEPYVADSEH